MEERNEMEREIEFLVPEEEAGKRLDLVLAGKCPDYTRSYLQKLCKEQRVRANEKIVKSNYKCRAGDHIVLMVPAPKELEVKPEEMDLDVVYEDQDVILVNKPKGMVVHPAAGHDTGTLVNGLLARCRGELSGINGVLRPGIVHRIDKDTTGILVVCKNDAAHQKIAEQLQEHSITRVYHAIVYGILKKDEGTIDAPIGRSPKDRKKMAVVPGGRRAVTHYKVIKRLKKDLLILNADWKRDGPTRSGYIWHPSDIHCWGMMYTVLRNRNILWKDSAFMQRFWDLSIRELQNIWNLKHLCRSILRNCW